ncbi:TonB-dependent receptor [Flagellimonas sp.]|uniref:TonB-dependent receptor n=1 Tax=Flagellimonas sp. TaxID=2058762 RepID=UPI003B5C0EF8
MRLTFIFLLVALFKINASSYSQATKVSLDLENVSVAEVFNEIKSKTEFKILYMNSEIDLERKVSVRVNKKRVERVLDILFNNTNIQYEIVGKQIVLRLESQKSIVKPKVSIQPNASLENIQQDIQGNITDADGGPLPGVNIVVQGTTTGTQSDFDGNYAIKASQGDVLVFTYLGMQTQTVTVGSNTTINVVMQEDAESLDEVVVVGYGTQKKATLSGSVATTTGEALEKSSAPNLTGALSGKVAGVFVDTGSSIPGSDNSAIRIRGTNTFRNSSALVVVDGIPDRAGGIARINPADIESISVLKDASAAIYGARAANGVILVTTKRGKKGPATVKFTSNYGLQSFTTLPDMLTGAEYMDLVNVLNVYKLPVSQWEAAHAGRGAPYTRTDNGDVVNPTFTNERIENTRAGNDPWAFPDTDWFEELTLKNAPVSRQNLQVSGGTENVSYLASLGHLKQAVNFRGAPDGFEQWDLRVNLDAKISEHLKLDVGLYGRQENNRLATRNIIPDLIRQYPWFPAYWPTGEFGPDIENGNNPAIRATDKPGYNDTDRSYMQSNIGLTFKVPGVDGLELRGNVSYDKFNRDFTNWNRPWQLYTWDGVNRDSSGLTLADRGPQTPNLYEEHNTRTDFTATFNASYEKEWGDHYFKILGGITREQVDRKRIFAFKDFFVSSDLAQLSFGGAENQNNGGDASEVARLNYYGRANYAYKSKYLLELLFRYDGSYLFPEDNRFGFFPGASAGWVLSEEPFFKEALPFFDFFKLRGSYGQMGNDRVGAFQFNSTYSLSFTGLDDVTTTAFEDNVANPDITWEKATSKNLGLDFKILNNKITVGVDYFINTREDILTPPDLTLPSITGIDPPFLNIGEFENKGFEVSLGINGGNDNGFSYDVTFNLSDSNNKLIFFDEPALEDRPWQRQTGGEIGRPLLYQFDGVFRTQAEIDAETLDYSGVTPALKPGDARVVDISGDGTIGPEDRRRTGGSAFADTQFGLNTAITYKNVDFNMYWAGATGGYSNYEWSFMSGTLANVQRDVRDRAWSLDNINAPKPRLADRGDQWYSGQTDAYLLTRDYIRLKTLEIGYNFADDIVKLIGAKSMRLSFSGTNLLTFTDFPFDPETVQVGNGDLSDNGIRVNDGAQGVSGGNVNNGNAYPLLKTYNVGFQVTF